MMYEYVTCFLGSEKRLNIVDPGEMYVVNCPFCNDTRHRLYINARWGVRDELGRTNMWLAHCFNEDCLATYARQQELLWQLDCGKKLEEATVRVGRDVDPKNVVAEWPGKVVRVDELDMRHPAVKYIQSRNFDPKVLGDFYNVHYCEDSWYWLAKDRLILPIYEYKKMVGWQARFVGEMRPEDKTPKYYTMPGFPRRETVYNLANASLYKTGVICEGIFDVFGFGPMAVCVFGSTMTAQQMGKFARAFKDRSAVLLFDPDVKDDPKKGGGLDKLVASLTKRLEGNLAVVWLPEGRDAGSMDRRWMRSFVKAEAKRQGVKVEWSRR